MVFMKLFEMKRGVKPFSVLHYKADMALRKKAAFVMANLRYVNKETARLFLLLIFFKARELASELWTRVEHFQFFEKIRGRYIEKGKGTVSAFLRKLSSRDSTDETTSARTTDAVQSGGEIK